MDRRTLLKGMIIGSAVAGASPSISLAASSSKDNSEDVRDYLSKIKNYNKHFDDDIVLTGHQYKILVSTVKRLKRLQRTVGYANFSLLSFDSALKYARSYSRIGRFPKEEIDFLEEVFYTDADDYGFFGEKVTTKLTEGIPNRDTIKVPHTGHYLFRGDSLRLYQKIRRDIGKSIVLTSGVRGVVKQMHLFLSKAIRSDGNLSMASRSLAPPGHSFHGRGDFDVGKVGYGYRNFRSDFAETREFKRLEELGYIRIRYHEKNPFGVRFEPWHIKVS